MKITIEADGQETKVFDDVLGYQLIVTTAADTQTIGCAIDGIGLERTMTMAMAVDKLNRKFKPFNEMRIALEELSDEKSKDRQD